jgi:hypothetical protein
VEVEKFCNLVKYTANLNNFILCGSGGRKVTGLDIRS